MNSESKQKKTKQGIINWILDVQREQKKRELSHAFWKFKHSNDFCEFNQKENQDIIKKNLEVETTWELPN